MPDPTAQPEKTPATLERLTRDDTGHLVAHLRGQDEPVTDVRLARCFPWSQPDDYISIRKDSKEIVLLTSLEGLDPPTRNIIDHELRDKVFNPRIHRIVDHTHEFGVTSITAETDRGKVTFQIRSRDDVRLLSPTRALFRDADGNTYDLPDFTAMDTPSQKLLQEYF